jgi:uncharacterized membrane protein
MLMPAGHVRGPLLEFVKTKQPDWDPEGTVCVDDLNKLRTEYIESLLNVEKKEVSDLEDETAKSIQDAELITKNLNNEFDSHITTGEKIADKVAAFGGSWKFIILFGLGLGAWIIFNSIHLLAKPFDPFPFIFLNLVAGILAALQAPVIMMSQNRQESKDRFRAEQDFKTNLKAELEIRYVHDKLDYLLMHQWQRLLEIQEVQMDLMEQLGAKRDDKSGESSEKE